MLNSWNLRISEVSGLGARRNPYSGLTEVLGVGDEDVKIAVVEVHKDGHPAVAEPKRVKGVDQHKKSGWEGVAGDVSGRIFVLQEESSELLVITSEFVLERRIRLTHPWLDDKHYGLESLLLLREGHFVCAKQRKPVTFIEFGPVEQLPIGVTSNSVLSVEDEFLLPPGNVDNLTTMATWKIEEDGLLESVNDIALDYDGTMLAISSKSHYVGRFEHGLHPGRNHAKVPQHSKLPNRLFGVDAKTEGLLVDAQLGYLVAVDSCENATNLFRLNIVFT